MMMSPTSIMKKRLERQSKKRKSVQIPLVFKKVQISKGNVQAGYSTPKTSHKKERPEVMYSDDSYKRLATNDTTRLD